MWSRRVVRTRLLRRLKMLDTRTASQARHFESRELAIVFLLHIFSSNVRSSLRENILYVVTRCPHAAPRRLKIFSRRTGSSLSKTSNCVCIQQVFLRANGGISDFLNTLDMPVLFVLKLDPPIIVSFFLNTIRTLKAEHRKSRRADRNTHNFQTRERRRTLITSNGLRLLQATRSHAQKRGETS